MESNPRMQSDEEERRARREKIGLVGGTFVVTLGGTVIVLRIWPRAVLTLAGPSQVGSALRLRKAS